MPMNNHRSVNRGKAPARSPRPAAFAKAATLAFAIFAFASAQQAVADPLTRNQAKRMYDRLTGTPPSPAVLDQLETKVTQVGLADAALNDYTATVIGMVRDDKDFRGILSDDILYVGNSGPAYSATDNAHYEALESNNADLRAVLQPRVQSSLNGLPPEATAGVITSRAASEAFFIDGTNRAMFRFTLLNHLCRDMEQVHDTSRPPDRIRQDVTRSPGGDSSVFLNNCIGCHSGMDPMAQAFAYYDFDETVAKLVYTPGQVQAKYTINSDNFKPGFITPDDQWENRWRLPGLNKQLGWASNLPGKGAGAKSLGTELANSDAFAECQVEKVFRTVCLRTPADTTEQGKFDGIVSGFKSTGNLKRVFAETAAACAGN